MTERRPSPTDANPGDADASARFRALPSVHELVERHVAATADDTVPRSVVVDAARAVLAEERSQLERRTTSIAASSPDELATRLSRRLGRGERPPLAAVINATGIIIHTGLGRAPLADAAVRAMVDAAAGYAPVELDLASGERGKRNRVVSELLAGLTGAEAGTVVNNNAAALMLVLSTMVRGRAVVVSRGELIEIGGSFRLPDVMAAGGAVLREVGTTNRTRLADYERAIDEDVAAVMKVHTSNYRVEGFTESVATGALVALAHERGIPVIDDVGSGVLVDDPTMPDEPSATASIAAGADVVLFSGDKLLGGPQAGLIVGRAPLIAAIEKNPMMRAMRVDKITLAALHATLMLHRDPAQAATAVPVRTLLTATMDDLRARGAQIVEALATTSALADVRCEDSQAFLGGGSDPARSVPSVVVTFRPTATTDDDFARRLRTGHPGVIPRVKAGRIHLDLRTVFPEQDAMLIDAIGSVRDDG